MGKHKDFCVILAGGAGKRLWPCSRRALPKQFMDFFGTGKTLLQQTYERMARFIPREQILISTFDEYVDLVKEQLPQVPLANILAEPVQLSTAPAAAWASYHIAAMSPDANVIMTPCDQHIVNEDLFIDELRDGLSFVEKQDAFLCMGVKAACPNTSYGYIQMGKEKTEGVYAVQSFTEKPDMHFAKKFVESGEFLWNTGLFLFTASSIKRMLNELMPVIDEAFEQEGGQHTWERELEIIQKFYPVSLHRSFDLVVLESGKEVYVKECHFGWADIGTWPDLHEVGHKDVDGNAVLGKANVMFSDSQNNLIYLPSGKHAVVRGLDGFLVAEEGGVMVICPNNDSALVGQLLTEAQMTFGEKYI